MRNWRGPDLNRAGVGFVEETKDVEQRALAAARRADDRVNAPGFEIERNATQRVHARFLFAEITFNLAATERKFPFHKLDPRKVSTG